mmetsp:Transcript_97156/g.290262  ORF Transcript_97156/g.290262 Transcript_97156/m.290262 type:complete len:208 (-) Transcript_97156:546-1169(-)
MSTFLLSIRSPICTAKSTRSSTTQRCTAPRTSSRPTPRGIWSRTWRPCASTWVWSAGPWGAALGAHAWRSPTPRGTVTACWAWSCGRCASSGARSSSSSVDQGWGPGQWLSNPGGGLPGGCPGQRMRRHGPSPRPSAGLPWARTPRSRPARPCSAGRSGRTTSLRCALPHTCGSHRRHRVEPPWCHQPPHRRRGLGPSLGPTPCRPF